MQPCRLLSNRAYSIRRWHAPGLLRNENECLQWTSCPFLHELWGATCPMRLAYRTIHFRTLTVTRGEGQSAIPSQIDASQRFTGSSDHVTRNHDSLARRADSPATDLVGVRSKWRKYKRLFPSTKLRHKQTSQHTSVLGQWLQLKTVEQRRLYWESVSDDLSNFQPSIALVYFMHLRENPIEVGQDLSSADISLRARMETTMNRRQITFTQLGQWANILLVGCPTEQLSKFISYSGDKPIPLFVLQEILHGDIDSVHLLKETLIYIWRVVLDQVVGTSPHSNKVAAIRSFQRSESALFILLVRLVYQARRIWPAAIVTVSVMIQQYITTVLDTFLYDTESAKMRVHQRYCLVANRMIQVLSNFAIAEPYRSVTHNLAAQRNILQLAPMFSPPLLLDQLSYQSVVRVLVASRKSAREHKAASLRTRDWPPWHFDQDGVDAQRDSEDDMSRAVRALMRLAGAGYPATQSDKLLRVLGGKEHDGSPTIQTRRIKKNVCEVKSYRKNTVHRPNPRVWTARVSATRDVQEAWTAFRTFIENGGAPNLPLYQAMFEKLEFEFKRTRKNRAFVEVAGDGKEVLCPADKGYSESFRMQLQPPDREELYQNMLDRGIRPAGECLCDLVRSANTISTGLQYLRDAGISDHILDYLSSCNEDPPPNVLEELPDSSFESFVSLLCRFAIRTFPPTPSNPNPTVYGPAPRKSAGNMILNPLLHTLHLVHGTNTTYRPIWYQLFSALARPRTLISDNPTLSYTLYDDVRSWKIFTKSLATFHSLHLELDARGFGILCQMALKYTLACQEIHKVPTAYVEDCMALVYSEWRKVSSAVPKDQCEKYHLPRLHYALAPHALHKYIRLLGRVEYFSWMVECVEWMVDTEQELQALCEQTANGYRMMKRCIVALRVYCDETPWQLRIKELVESVQWWGGWATDADVLEYGEGAGVFLEWRPG